jgi:1-aminocyclopropane-1-carboxylate deaminase/D-cysteine desulfhydrase-like pyridoxal-dependent ACC family enzyme
VPLLRDHHLAAFVARPPARLALAELPTPVERAPWLDAPGAEVWVKRDDRTSAVYGGGKVRKLEWLLAAEPWAGDGPVLSLGGIGSHHLLALGLFLRAQGRELHALTFDQTPTPHVRETLAALLSTGARLWSVRSRVGLPWAWLAYHLWDRPARQGAWMPAGGSNGVGGLGFVEAGLELGRQIDAGLLPRPTAVYVTGGSAATSAGLAIGLALAGVSTHLRVVSAVERWLLGRSRFRGMVGQIWRELRRCGLHPELAAGGWPGLLQRAKVTWSIDHAQVGPGYAVPTAAGAASVALAEGHGLRLETTYTGKCAAALRAELAAGARQGPVLLWNTHAGTDLAALVRPGWQAGLPARLHASLGA